jgi:acetylornithine deacetylase/succinyl-diaminopimelate desuccinylase-like protein
VGNVIATLKGSIGAKTIVVAAHLDTVFPPETVIKVRREGNRLIAPGIGDNTRGLIMVNALMKAIHTAQIRMQANVLLVGTVGEEGLGDLRGVKHLFRDGAPGIDGFIAIDGGNPARIVTAAVGSYRYRVSFAGSGGHSWRAFGQANPHHALGRAIALLDENGPSVTDEGEKSSYNIGRIGGGTSVNSIPFSSWMEVDIRSGSQERLDRLDAIFRESVQQALLTENDARKLGPALTVDIEKVGERPAGSGDRDSSLVKNMLAIQEVYGYETTLDAGSTDSSIPISKGIPAVTISRGGKGGNAHSLEEWWENDKGYEAIQIALLLLVAEAGLAE